MLQVLGVARSGHALYSMTGHFHNPGPFGGFVAMLLSVCLSYLFLTKGDSASRRLTMRLCALATVFGFIVLPASMSRAGWLGLAISMAVLACRNKKIRYLFAGSPFRKTVVLLVLITFCVGGILLKTDSALGRIHIWHMELLAMLKAPFTGFGIGRFAWAYGETQATYFATGKRPLWQIRVAGCPEYAFNEYLKTGVECGMPGFVLAVGIAILVCVALIRNNNPLGYGALSLAIFSLFSYPMSLWQFQICGGIYIVATILELANPKQKWTQLAFVLPLLIRILFTSQSESHRNNDYRLIYHQGYMLYQEGRYDKAIDVLREGAELSCDPMFHNIIGRCYEATGRLSEAEIEYWHSHHMVPRRLYPLVLLQELYLSNRDTTNAEKAYSVIAELPVNHRNSNMKALRERADNNHQQSLLNNKSL